MKRVLPVIILGLVALAACSPAPTANDEQRDQQARITSEGAAEVGMPNITHFREMRLYKLIYELRDQDNLSTYTYVYSRSTGKFTLLCPSIGFPIPYAAQYSAPESMQTYNVHNTASTDDRTYGVEKLPQAEPNGLNMPSSANGTWVLCIGPSNKPNVTYVEPDVSTFLYKLPDSMLNR